MNSANPKPAIHAIFAPDLRRCAIVVITSGGNFKYDNLRVRRIGSSAANTLFMVLIPCEADIGHNLMAGFDWEAMMSYKITGHEPKPHPMPLQQREEKGEILVSRKSTPKSIETRKRREAEEKLNRWNESVSRRNHE